MFGVAAPLSTGAVGARFAENSGKVLPELRRFPAVRRLGREPGAEEGFWMLLRSFRDNQSGLFRKL